MKAKIEGRVTYVELRGCGERAQNGLYLCVGVSPFGKPIEYFLVDPALAWKGSQLRAPMLIEDSKSINHLVMWIGKTYYPFVPDFVEETRLVGVSKRVPRNFDVSVLVPGKSRLLLVHPNAIPRFDYRLVTYPKFCPTNLENEHECIGDLWSLSTLHSVGEVHKLTEISDGRIRVSTPSCQYSALKPLSWDGDGEQYSSGIIMMFPTFHFEYVNNQRKVPKTVKERIQKAGFKLEVLPT